MVDMKIRNSMKIKMHTNTNNNNTNLGLLTKRRVMVYYRNTLHLFLNLEFVPSPNNIRKGFVVKAKKVEDDETQRERERDEASQKKRTKLSIQLSFLNQFPSRKILKPKI